MHDTLHQLVPPTSLRKYMSLVESINIFLDQPSNMDKLGDKSYMSPPEFTFSVICIMEEQSLDIALKHGFPNHTLVLSTMIGILTK